jgi:hypothetical protein
MGKNLVNDDFDFEKGCASESEEQVEVKTGAPSDQAISLTELLQLFD